MLEGSCVEGTSCGFVDGTISKPADMLTPLQRICIGQSRRSPRHRDAHRGDDLRVVFGSYRRCILGRQMFEASMLHQSVDFVAV